MKKLALTCSILLALVAFSTPNADAQFCFKFTSFCDGVQVDSIVNQQISATWYHFDCANNTPMTNGSKGEAPISDPCPGGNGSGVVNCANCGGFGDWSFVIDAPLDGTFDMAIGTNPGGSCWIDELGYAIQMGACTGLRNFGKGPAQAQNRSTVQ